MMITAFSTFRIKPDQIDNFLAITRENMAQVRAEEGSIEMRLFANADTAGMYHLFGRTSTADAFAKHEADIIARGVPERTATTIAAPPESLPLIETEDAPDPVRKQPDAGDDMVSLFFAPVIKDGYRNRVIAQMQKHVAESRKEPGNLTFEFYTVEGDPKKMVVFERWRNGRAIWDDHMKQPHSVETGALLDEAMIGKFEDHLIRVTEIDPY